MFRQWNHQAWHPGEMTALSHFSGKVKRIIIHAFVGIRLRLSA